MEECSRTCSSVYMCVYACVCLRACACVCVCVCVCPHLQAREEVGQLHEEGQEDESDEAGL